MIPIRDLQLMAHLPFDCWIGEKAAVCGAGGVAAKADHFAMADAGLRKLTWADMNVRTSVLAPLPGGGAAVAIMELDVAVTGGLMSFVLPRLLGHPPQEIVTEGPPILEEKPRKPTPGKALDTMVEDPAASPIPPAALETPATPALPRPIATALEGVRQMIVSAAGEEDDGAGEAEGTGDDDAVPSRRPGRPGAQYVSVESRQKVKEILDGIDWSTISQSRVSQGLEPLPKISAQAQEHLIAALAAALQVDEELTLGEIWTANDFYPEIDERFRHANALVQLRDEIDYQLLMVKILGAEALLLVIIGNDSVDTAMQVLRLRMKHVDSAEFPTDLNDMTTLGLASRAWQIVQEARTLEDEEDFVQAAAKYAEVASIMRVLYEVALIEVFDDRFIALHPEGEAIKAIKVQLYGSDDAINFDWLASEKVAAAASGAINNRLSVLKFAEEMRDEEIDEEMRRELIQAKILITTIIQIIFDHGGMEGINKMLDVDDRERRRTEEADIVAGREPRVTQRLRDDPFIQKILERRAAQPEPTPGHF